MRTVLHLFLLVFGAALVHRGLSQGLPGPPFHANQWGVVAAFGFGVMLVLVGLRQLWLGLTDHDGGLGGGTALLMLVASAALTAGAVAWKGGKVATHGPSPECAAVMEHLQELVASYDTSAEASTRFESIRPALLRRCEQMTSEERQCPLSATTFEEVRLCR